MTALRWALAPEDEGLFPSAHPHPGRVLCWDDTGERALAWAAAGAEVWRTGRPEGRALLDLKVACARLSWEEGAQVLGLLAGGRRVWLYHRLRSALPEPTRRHWDLREDRIRRGVLQDTPGEQVLARWRRALGAAGVVPWPAPEGRGPDRSRLTGRRARALGALTLAPAGLPADLGARCATRTLPNPWVEWVLLGDLREPGLPRQTLGLGRERLPELSGAVRELDGPPPAGAFDVVDLGVHAAWPPEAPEALAPGGVLVGWGPAAPGRPGLEEDPLPAPETDRAVLVAAPPRRVRRVTGCVRL